jgi:hypothetical protein
MPQFHKSRVVSKSLSTSYISVRTHLVFFMHFSHRCRSTTTMDRKVLPHLAVQTNGVDDFLRFFGVPVPGSVCSIYKSIANLRGNIPNPDNAREYTRTNVETVTNLESTLVVRPEQCQLHECEGVQYQLCAKPVLLIYG